MSTYYYAIRHVDKDDALTLKNAMSKGVTSIATHNTSITTSWIDRNRKPFSKFLSPITVWEYDMLEAFGVHVTTVIEMLAWKNR